MNRVIIISDTTLRTWKIIFVFSPTVLLLVMAMLRHIIGSLSVQIPSAFLFAWVGFIWVYLRKCRGSGKFFAWSSIVSALLMVFVPFVSASMGIYISRDDPFPAHLIMFPSVVFLLLVSIISVGILAARILRRNFKKNQDGNKMYKI